MICDHVAWPSALYNHKQMQAGQLHSIISKRSRPGKCIHAFGLWIDAVEICPRNRPQLCNSIHNSFHKHNMEATLSHMQTHGQIKDWGAEGDICILNC